MTPFSNKESQKKMLEFLKRNYKDANTLTGKDYYLYASDPTTNLSYSPKRGILIGFNYNAHGFEREYIFQICSWMAMVAGKTKKFEGKDLQFIIYDGVEDIVIAREKIEFKKGVDQRIVDEFGFCQSVFASPLICEFEDGGAEAAAKIIRNQLIELTDLYKKAK